MSDIFPISGKNKTIQMRAVGWWGTCIHWPELYNGVVFLRSGWGPGSLPVFQCSFAVVVGPTSSPGSRLCQDSPLRGCTFQHPSPGLHNKWKTPTASPRLFFSLGCGTWPCQCLGKQFLPFLCYSADCQKKGSRVSISKRSYLKGQENFADCLSSWTTGIPSRRTGVEGRKRAP